MAMEQILFMLDAEIARLEQVRSLLAGVVKPKPRRTKKSKPAPKEPARKKPQFTPEGLEQIRQSTLKRWREMKKAGVKSSHLAAVK